MGLGRRIWNRVRSIFTETPAPSPPVTDSPSPPDRESEPPPGSDLPNGWKFEGLYYGDRAPSERRVINHDPSDYQIAMATDVIVSYTDALGTVYRTVHGANSRQGVGSLIGRTVQVVSPPR